MRDLSILMIFIGALFLSLAFLPARKIWRNVSGQLRRKWLLILILMTFFLLGYILFDAVLFFNLSLPLELVTGGVFLGGAVFVFIIINLSQNTITAQQKAEEDIKVLNESLEQRVAVRTRELKQLNTKLQESQESIQESLNCASVIQKSILPRKDLFDQQFSEWLILYCPRDVVGGDLYWLREINGLILLAVIDCTGHGVPGAFMTMTVNSVLNHVVDTICTDDPASILAEINKTLHKTLHFRRDGDSMVDAGLDIVLCCIDHKQHKLTFAGAGLSLYMLTDNELFEIKGDRPGIGYSGSNPDFKYTNNVRDFDIGTTLYAYTDGFLDENGGTKGFGFGRDRFKKMLIQHSHQTLERQKEFFEKTLADWQGSRSQRDDITLVGIRL